MNEKQKEPKAAPFTPLSKEQLQLPFARNFKLTPPANGTTLTDSWSIATATSAPPPVDPADAKAVKQLKDHARSQSDTIGPLIALSTLIRDKTEMNGRSKKAASPLENCKENTKVHHMVPHNDPLMKSALQYQRFVPGIYPSWVHAIQEHARPTFEFPKSHIDYQQRLRQHAIEFVFEGTPKTKADELYVDFSAAKCEEMFLRCKIPDTCPHRIVPLLISVVETECVGVEQGRALALQIETDEFQALCEHYSPLHQTLPQAAGESCLENIRSKRKQSKSTGRTAWIRNTTTIMKKTTGEKEEEDSYGYAVRPGSNFSSSVVYRAGKDFAFADNYELLSALSFRRCSGIGPEKYILRTQDKGIVHVQQPDATGRCPSVVSYIVSNSVWTKENGMSATSLANATRTDTQTKNKFWGYPERTVLEMLDSYGHRLTRYQMVMNHAKGMRISLRPLFVWSPAKNFSIRMKLLFDYVVVDC